MLGFQFKRGYLNPQHLNMWATEATGGYGYWGIRVSDLLNPKMQTEIPSCKKPLCVPSQPLAILARRENTFLAMRLLFPIGKSEQEFHNQLS
jgi:hypothetical protein